MAQRPQFQDLYVARRGAVRATAYLLCGDWHLAEDLWRRSARRCSRARAATGFRPPPAGPIPFTPHAKKRLNLALREALQLGHHYLGTEHILLGLVREGEGVAAEVLAGFGADHAHLRDQVQRLLTGEGEQTGQRTRLVHMTVPADLHDYDEKIAQVRQEKEAAIDACDFAAAAALRDREKQLLADKLRREQEWAAGVDVQAVIAENRRVHHELERLRGLLRQHGIEPDGGTAQTA